MNKPIFVGAAWCNLCGPTKEKLIALGVDFGYVSADSDRGETICVEKGLRALPSVVLPNGGVLAGASKIIEYFTGEKSV